MKIKSLRLFGPSAKHGSKPCHAAMRSLWVWGVCLTASAPSLRAHIYASWDWSTGNWNDASRWSSDPKFPHNGQPVAGDTYSVDVSAGVITRNMSPTVSLLDFSGGTIGGTGVLTVTGATSWSGGKFDAGDVNLNGGVSITGNARFSGSSAELMLASGETAEITGGGSLSLENQTKVINSGVFLASTNSGITEVGPFQSNFTNNGTFTRNSGTGTFTVGVTQFHNNGALNINVGTVDLAHGVTNAGPIQIAAGATLKTSGGSIFNAGTSFSGTGLWHVADGQQHVHLSTAIPAAVKLAAGEITLYNGHTLTLNGALDWAGGTLSRESNFFGGDRGFVTLNGGGTVRENSSFYGLTVTNAAASSVTVTEGRSLNFGGDAVLTNAGSLVFQSNTKLAVTTPGGNQVNNTGTLTSATDFFNPAMIEVALVNSGTVNSTAGELRLSGGGESTGVFQAAASAYIGWYGGYTFHAGTSFGGDGAFGLMNGIQTMDASLTTAAEFSVSSTLNMPSGITFTHTGELYFGGHLTGGGTILADHQLQLSGGSITGSVLTNASGGTATHHGTIDGYTVTLHNGGVFRNQGDFIADDTGGFAAGTGSNNRFENSGSFTREFSTDPYTISCLFANTGSVAVDAGTLRLSGGGTSNGGTWTIADLAKVELSGAYQFSGTNTATGDGQWIFGTPGGAGPSVTHQLGGTLLVANPVTLGNAVLSIDPSANVSASGAFDALQGTLTGGGTFHANGTTTIGDLMVDGATLEIGVGAEASHASASWILLKNGGVLTNAGTFLASSNKGIDLGAGTGNAFNNSGTFTGLTVLDTYTVEVPFHNSGTVLAQDGILSLAGGGSSSDGTWQATGGRLVLSGNYAMNGTTAFTGTGTIALNSGVFTVNGPLNASSPVEIFGGVDLAVQPTQTVTTLAPLRLLSGTGNLVISGGGTLQANAGITLYTANIHGTTVNNAAAQTATHFEALPLVLSNGGVFNNAGSYLATGDASITQDAAPTNLFRNSGTFTRDPSAGVFTVDANFENTGLVQTITGTLAFGKPVTAVGGTFDTALGAVLTFSASDLFDSSAPFTGVGEVKFVGGVQTFVQSSTVASVLTLASGSILLPPAGALDANGYFHWAGGALTGTGIFNTNGGMDLTQAVTLADATLAIPSGSVAIQSGAGKLVLNGPATVTNAGTYHAANEQSISPGTGSGFAFNNIGTLTRDTGVGVFAMAVPFHNSGTVDVQSGVFSFSGGGTSTGIYQVAADTDFSLTGNTEFSGNSEFTGTGRVNFQNGIQTIADSMPSSVAVSLSGGTLAILPNQEFQSNGGFRWSGGLLTGGGILDIRGALNATHANLTVDGSTLRTSAFGIATIESAGAVLLKNGGVLDNQGTLFLLNNGSFTAADASAVSVENTGTITRDTGTGQFTFSVPFNHSGVFNINTGSVWLNGGGTAANSNFNTQVGTALYVGTNYTFGPNNSMTGSGATHFSGGSLHVTGSLVTDGSFNWTGGTLDGGGIFTVKGGLTITPSSGVYINGATLENATGSEAIISGTAATNILNGGTYRNSGLTRLRGNNNFSDGGGGANRIVNSGTLLRDSGTGNYFVTVPIDNTGTIRSTSGALLINAGGSASAGALDADGGSIYLNGGSYEFSGGAITGANYIYLSAGTALVTGDTGATSGPATGGFGIVGGTLGGTAMLSVERGYFTTGHMTGTAVLRLTGTSSKANNTHLTMAGGTIRNDGTFNQGLQANFDTDSSAGDGGGTIENTGIWNLTNNCSFSNSYGGGSIYNSGEFNQVAGGNVIHAAFHNQAGGVVRATAGYVYLSGGGTQVPGSLLDGNGGHIYFNGGTHLLSGGTITGSYNTYASAGTVSVSGDVGASSGAATGGFGIAGGTVTGSAMISAERGYFATGHISGSVVLRCTGTSRKVADTHLTMSGGTISNEGTFNQELQANIDTDNHSAAGGGTIENIGTWNLINNCSLSNSYQGGSILNSGDFNQVGGGNSIHAAFHNQEGGVIRATAGYVLLNGGGTQVPDSTLDADGGYIYFNGGTHLLTGGTLTGSHFTYASVGTVSISGNVGETTGAATGGFGIAGGTVTGTAMVSADHGYFSTGHISGSVVLRYTGASTKAANTHLTMSGGTIRNEGTFSQGLQANIDTDNAAADGGGTIINVGTWNLTDNCALSNSYDGGEFRNLGELNHKGVSNINAVFHSEATGVINATTGSLRLQGGGTQVPGAILNANGGNIYFNGGTHELSGGLFTGNSFTYTSAGTARVVGDVGATSGAATGGFGIAGGTVTGSAIVSADHGYFATGHISGSVVLRYTGTSSKANNTHLTMSGGTIRNEGTFNQGLQANIDTDSGSADGGGALVNVGIWNLNDNCSISNSYGAGVFRNSGTLNHVGTSTINAAFHNEATGIVNATTESLRLQGGGTQVPGSVLNANGGNIYFNGGTHGVSGGLLTGNSFTYASAGTVSVTGDVGATDGPATGGFGVAGGTVTGSAMVSAERGYFATGHLSGSVVLRYTGTSSKAANSYLTMSGGTIRNEGTFNQGLQANFDTDSASVAGGGTIENSGTWNLLNNCSITNSYDGGVIRNSGVFNQVEGGGVVYAAFHNQAGGVIRATKGYIYLQGGGTQVPGSTIDGTGGHIYFNGGTHVLTGGTLVGFTTFASAGTVNVTGDVGATSGPATGGFGISGGTVTGTAMISADVGYFATGHLAGTAVLRYTGASSKASNTYLTMSGGTIRNEGTFTQGLQANFDLDSSTGAGGGTIDNRGTWNLVANCSFYNSYDGGSLVNSGLIDLTAGTVQVYTPVTNSGTLRASAGTMYLRAGSSHSGALVTGGHIVLVGGGHAMAGAGASLGGSGALSGNMSLSDGAKLAPGNSAGKLTLYDTVTCAAGGEPTVYQAELAGATSHDQVWLADGSTLNLGTGVTNLQVPLLYAPAYGSTFRIIDSSGTGKFTGTFANAPTSGSIITTSFEGQTYALRVSYGVGGKTLDVTVLVPYLTWAYQKGLSGDDALFDADPDGDGISNGIEFVIGGEPNPTHPNWHSVALLPQVSVDETYLRVTYRRTAMAAELNPGIEFGTDLQSPWTFAEDGVGGVVIQVTAAGYGAGIDRVEARIPRTHAVGGKLFGRLTVTNPE